MADEQQPWQPTNGSDMVGMATAVPDYQPIPWSDPPQLQPQPSTSFASANNSGGIGSLSGLQGFVHGVGAPGTSNSFSALQDVVRDPDERPKPVNPFQVDTSLIGAIPANQQAAELKELGLQVFNQDEFEEGIMAQVDTAMAAQEQERMEKILKKELKTLEEEIRPCRQELQNMEKVIQLLTPQATTNKEISRRLVAVKQKRDVKSRQLKKLKAKQKSLSLKINGNLAGLDEEDLVQDGSGETSMLEQALLGLGPSAMETDTERMIRLGEMTPFGTTVAAVPKVPATPVVTDFEQYLMDQDKKKSAKKKVPRQAPSSASKETDTAEKKAKKRKNEMRKSHSESSLKGQDTSFKKAGSNFFDSKDPKTYKTESDYSKSSARKRKVYHPRLSHNFSEDRSLSDVEVGDEMNEEPWGDDELYLPPSAQELQEIYSSDDNSSGSNSKKKIPKSGSGDDFDLKCVKVKSGKKVKHSPGEKVPFTRARDDGNADCYQRRLKLWHKAELKRKHQKLEEDEPDTDEDSDMEFDRGFKVPARIWKKLYRYQKTGVKWLWELHSQQAGGILGDEMGLGKTIQIIAFLTGLRHSKLRDRAGSTRYDGLGPSIIVCPATVIHQWVSEFHNWSPAFRVCVLHSTGSYQSTEASLVHNVFRCNGILVMPYSSVVIYQDVLLHHDWHYVVLDEGHKIRNPNAQATIACKQFRTCHRLILSGSPMQNNLKELWSLFDFVFPGKLGTLPDFMAHFSVPIVQGGYANATQIQVQTAYKCACVLRDTINPYLLRRMKADVKGSLALPDKNEQVLFCRLTDHQREVYQEYIDSKECNQILSGHYMVFPGLITLRKVCNHPDLSTGGPRVFNDQAVADDETLEYGYWQRSGKLIVVASLLKIWKKQGHRVLFFSQSKQLLDIMEEFVQKRDYTYLRMDGGTTIGSRQPLIVKYNNDPSIFIFLLTTRVGGLGVNLTGADRVVIFDPDWNPSTDTQARERAWRIGQTRPVTVYRLLTTGTIEEKIYHRQIFKQFLANRVLKDPKQRRFFKANDLYELFTLGDSNPQDGTETSAIFAGTGSDIKVKVKARRSKVEASGKVNRFDRLKEIAAREKDNVELEESDDEMATEGDTNKLAKMRELAKLLSKRISEEKKSDESKNKSEDTSHVTQVADSGAQKSEDPNPSGQKEDISGVEDVGEGAAAAAAAAADDDDPEKKKRKKKRKKKHRSKKSARQKRKDKVLEGEKIAHLDKLSVYTSQRDNAEDNPPADQRAGDDYVLQKLFKKTGIHSALQHDKIMMSSDPDYALVEGEADRVAAEAARALKQSRARCLPATSGVPTWTGQSGLAGAPPKPRFGQKKNPILATKTVVEEKKKVEEPKTKPYTSSSPSKSYFDGTFAGNVKTNPLPGKASHDLMSSNEMLSRMKARNHMTSSQTNQGEEDEEGGGAPSVDLDPCHVELITDIRNFIAFGSRVDGQASTQELLDQFGKRVPADSSANFKSMLKQLCEFYKKDGMGVWKLKPAFR